MSQISDQWLDLLLRDASAEELTAYGASVPGAGEHQIVMALRIKALLAQRAQRARELATLNDMAGRLLSLRSPADLLPEVVDQARRLLRVDLAYLGLVRQDQDLGPVLRLEVTSGALTPELVGVEVPLDSGLAGAVLTGQRPLWSVDYLTDRSFRHSETADAAAAAENMHGLLGAPLTVRGKVIGALFASEREPREFAEEEVTLLCALAAHAGIALDNAAVLERLQVAGDELASRTAELEQIVAWDRRLTDVVLGGGGVEELVGEVASALAVDVRFVAQHPSAPDDRPAEGFAVSRTVAAAGRDLGSLVLSGDEPPSASDLLVLDRAAPVLALAMLAQESAAEASDRARHLGLLELLTSSPDDASRRGRQLRLAGLDPALSYSIAVVTLPGAEVAAVRRTVAGLHLPPGGSVVVHHGRVVLLSPGPSPDDLTQALRDDPRLVAGIAGPVTATGDLAGAHREAVETLQVVEAVEGRGVTTAEQLGIYRVLLSRTGRADLREASRRLLGRLEDEEARRGVPLLRTVRVFLDHAQRPGPAAGGLGIHVNTLYQRLATVDRLLGVGWRQPERSLELHLLLRLRDGLGRLVARE